MSAAKLPNSHQAAIADTKLTGYLLNDEHPRGKSKAKFFKSFGFSREEWETLGAALIVQGQINSVVATSTDTWGTRYEVLCNVPTPDQRNPCIRTVWQITSANPLPQLITAIPK